MSAFNLSSWLRKNPQPKYVMADDQKIAVSGGGRQWRDMVRAIEDLNPSKIVALNANNEVIRTHDFGRAPEEGAPADTSGDTEIETFAKLLAAAYKDAQTSNQPLINNSFTFIERLTERAMSAEQLVAELRGDNTALTIQIANMSAKIAELTAALSLYESAGGDDVSITQLLAQLAQGMNAGKAQQKLQPIAGGKKEVTK